MSYLPNKVQIVSTEILDDEAYLTVEIKTTIYHEELTDFIRRLKIVVADYDIR